MNKTKIQHYVPQVYLRYFASSDEKIYIFDKKKLQTRFQHIKHAACQNYFYDIDFDTLVEESKDELGEFTDEEIEEMKKIDEQYLEKFFSKTIEMSLPKFFDKILASFNFIQRDKYHKTQILTKNQKFEFSFLISFQLLRTKEFRNTINQAYLTFIETLLKKFHNLSLEGVLMEIRKELESLHHAAFLMNNEFIEQIANIINNYIWIFGINRTEIPFYTSDNPIVKNGHADKSFYGNAGLASKGVEIAYPINSKLILLIREKSYFSNFKDNNLKFYELNNKENIKYFNSLQVFGSNRQIFCRSDNFKLVREILNEYPEYRKEDRKRFDVN